METCFPVFFLNLFFYTLNIASAIFDIFLSFACVELVYRSQT